MLVFENPGLIDVTAATVLGINIKKGTHPIGQFGTGLKYAIAIVLRLGGSVVIWRGMKPYVFAIKKKKVRGETVELVTINGRELGFTAHLGAHWEPWMAYRELASNARDEAGKTRRVEEFDGARDARAKVTQIVVDCPELDKAHDERHLIFIQTESIVTTPTVEIHMGASEFLYYRGVRVHKLSTKSAYTYNLIGQHQLTEDRTLQYTWMVNEYIASGIVECTSRPVLYDVLSAKGDVLETKLNFSSMNDKKPSPQFMEVAEELLSRKELSSNATTLFNNYRDTMPGYVSPYMVDLSEIESGVLDRAIDLLRSRDLPSPTRASVRFKTQLTTGKMLAGSTEGITLEIGVLREGADVLASYLLEGMANIAGGSPSRQLAMLAVKGGFMPREALSHRPAGTTPDMPF